MFNKHQKHPCMQKISIFYRKTKKLRKGAPGEEYQTGPFLNKAIWSAAEELRENRDKCYAELVKLRLGC